MESFAWIGGVFFMFFGFLSIALLAFFIVALVSILQTKTLSPSYRALWVLASLAAPFLGPLFWFIWGRKEGTFPTSSTVSPGYAPAQVPVPPAESN